MRKFLFVVMLLLVAGIAQAASNDNLLAKIDAWRLTDESLEVETEVAFVHRGVVEKTRQYRVWIAPGRRSLALFQHPAERGQKALMHEDAFWLFLPNAARPVRITPLQKLIGDAAVGDIASLSLADDYQVEKVTVEDGSTRLDLSAKRSSVTYAKMVLWTDSKTHAPQRASLYAAGGRLLKETTFESDRRQVNAMRITDAVEPERVTNVRYLSRKARKFSEETFNPAYLARNPDLQ